MLCFYKCAAVLIVRRASNEDATGKRLFGMRKHGEVKRAIHAASDMMVRGAVAMYACILICASLHCGMLFELSNVHRAGWQSSFCWVGELFAAGIHGTQCDLSLIHI